jgi:hypothetical protein
VSALRAGDLFPLWWNEGALGLGAPMPLLYHKLFNIVAGPLYLAAGSYRAAAAIAVFLFSVLGVYGLRAAGSVLIEARASRWLALVFPHLNYALTDWLVRGAFAEFAAMAVGTWLLWWCLRLACTGQVERGLPLIALCLLLAHAVMAALGAVIVALAVLVRAVRHRAEALAVLRRLGAPAAATALVTAPLAILMLFTLGRVNTETLVRDFHPTRQFVAVTRYVHDRRYRWGQRWEPLSIRIDAPLLLAVAAGLVAGARRLRRGAASPAAAVPLTADRTEGLTEAQRCGWALLGGTVLVFGFLQFPPAAWLYLNVPGLALLQFPWRLLTYLAPIAVLLAGLAIDLGCRAWGRSPAPWTALLAVSMIATSPAFRPIRYEWIPARALESIRGPAPGQWPEYWPRLGRSDSEMAAMLEALRRRGVEDVGTGHCRGTVSSGGYLAREHEIECREASVVALPVAHYGLERVTVVTHPGTGPTLPAPSGVRRAVAPRPPDDPRLRVALPRGRHHLRVELPTVGRLLGFHQ